VANISAQAPSRLNLARRRRICALARFSTARLRDTVGYLAGSRHPSARIGIKKSPAARAGPDCAVPTDGLAQSPLERFLRLPAKFALDLARINSVAPIVAGRSFTKVIGSQ
jgi:hypothetical protein